MTGFVADPAEATSVGECPYSPTDPDWRWWQRAFARAQSVDQRQVVEAKAKAQRRAAAAGLTLHEPTLHEVTA